MKTNDINQITGGWFWSTTIRNKDDNEADYMDEQGIF